MNATTEGLTILLQNWRHGDKAALDQLMSMVYQTLKKIAQNHMNRERPGHTLAATALVNEAFCRLVDQKAVNWHNRAHFFAIAAQMMRRILADYAKAKGALKRGGQWARVSLGHVHPRVENGFDPMALHEALEVLQQIDPRQARLVNMRFIAGMSIEEIRSVTGLAPSTVHKELKAAKGWLFHRLRKGTL